MIRRMFLLAIITLLLYACSSLDKGVQWYKPSDNYTVAEFQRDETACTKNRVLDEACLKARGWVEITADEAKGPAPVMKPGLKSGGGPPRY